MKILINILIFFTILFFLNILLYSTNLDYKNFIKWLKVDSDNELVMIDDEYILDNINDDKINNNKVNIKDDIVINNFSNNTWSMSDIDNSIDSNTWRIITEIDNNINIDDELKDLDNEENKIKEEENKLNTQDNIIELSLVDKKFLSNFKKYWLVESDYFSSLFDITNEYPEKYIEYTWSKLDIIFFLDQDYQKIVDFFDVVSFDLPFSIKEVNNFWDKSFYINLDNSDSYVRIVLLKNWRVFGIKVLKSEYNNIKEILK